jgi:anti-sigma factor RsiW
VILTCREIYGFLDEFLDGALDALTRECFERHLERCASCRRYLASYKTTLRVARQSEMAEAPARVDAPEDLVQAILASRRASLVRQPPE